MPGYVPDASAIVEYLLQTPAGLTIGELIADAELAAPELLDPEVMSSLRRFVLAGSLAEERALLILDQLADLPIERVAHRGLIHTAWRLYQNVSSYDALYVALAHIRGFTLLTADGRLARASGLGISARYIPAYVEL